MKQSLDHRIADAFAIQLSSTEIQALLDEADRVACAARDTNARAKALALDPATRPEDVAKARRDMEDTTFTSERLDNAAERLGGLLAEAKQRETLVEAKKEYELARIERDELVEELSQLYPEIAQELVSLLSKLEANNARLLAVNKLGAGPILRSAEGIARGAPANWEVSVDVSLPKLLQSVRLPSFKRNGAHGGYVWPLASRL